MSTNTIESAKTTFGAYVFVGVTDENPNCDCCGRTELKRVVVLRNVETEEFFRFGVVCAATMLRIPSAVVRKESKSAQDAVDAEARRVRDEEDRAEDARWQAFLDRAAPALPDRTKQIQYLGGFKSANAAYKASK